MKVSYRLELIMILGIGEYFKSEYSYSFSDKWYRPIPTPSLNMSSDIVTRKAFFLNCIKFYG